jgi:hypothetical protein
LPSLEARSLLRGYIEGFTWEIIDGNPCWSSVFNGFCLDVFFAVRGFTLDRKGL